MRNNTRNSSTEQMEAVEDMLKCADLAKLGLVIINCNYYCELNGNQFIPCEIGLCAFCMETGLMDMYWALVDPGIVVYFL